ncbi:unnamed protein product [Caenorhabditis auriculariae]|uniref:Uncharacterized protein n=1 Tax=Caenorhabditis auriculariae TaxID=2777116 RepID=A0A8S1GR33_9PELO|nr:unnamed protein product [Caenorhabditis auriculariae]
MLATLYNITAILLLTYADADDSVMRLYRTILKDYNNEIRPAVHPSAPINVTFVFSLTQIIDVDEKNQVLTTNAWVRLHWVDYKLVWDPRLYGNVTRLHIPSEKIWKPDIILYNNADAQYMKSVMSTDVIVDYLGNIRWPLSAIFTSSCPLDVKHYPFDRQTCLLKYASWAYDGTKINLVLTSEKAKLIKLPGDDSNYITNTEWSLIDIRVEKNEVIYSCCPEPYPFIDVHVTIERRAMFYVFNLILPCVLISLIALMGFYMPTDSGEKVTLGITSLLSTTVFLMLVAEGMPPTSEALPLIGIYYGVTIMLVALGTAMTVFTVNIHHNGVHGNPVPPLLQIFAFRFLSKVLFVHIEPFHSITHHVRHMYESKSNSQKENPHERRRSSSYQLKPTQELPLETSPSTTALCQVHRRLIEQENNNEDDEDTQSPSSPRSHSVPDKSTPVQGRKTRFSLSTGIGTPPRVKKVSFSTTTRNDSMDSPIYGRKFGQTQEPELPKSPARLVGDVFEEEFLRVMAQVHAVIERNEMRVAERDKRDAIALEWQQVAMVLDRFLLLVFLIGTTTATFLILNQRQIFED